MSLFKIVSLLLVLGVPALPRQVTAEPVLVEGRVVDEAGQAIDGVTLQVRGE